MEHEKFYILIIAAKRTLELIEHILLFVEATQLGTKMLVHSIRLDWLLLHVHVPHLDAHEVTGYNVTPVVCKFDVRD